MHFDHERLDVYQAGRRLNRELRTLLEELPRGHAESRDNLRRAAQSITRNIAEGAGKWSLADKIRFYHIARGSATECAASLDELVDMAGVDEERVVPAKEILARIIAMLIGMIRSLESRPGKSMARSKDWLAAFRSPRTQPGCECGCVCQPETRLVHARPGSRKPGGRGSGTSTRVPHPHPTPSWAS